MDELKPPNQPIDIIKRGRGFSVTFRCDVCGEYCELKKSHFDTSKYHYCSRRCFYEHKKITTKGSHNHQYGLRGSLNASFKSRVNTKLNNGLKESLIYVGDWYVKPTEHGRVKEHRYVVELNYFKFDRDLFDEINGWFYLKDGIEVHHIDFNHNNNDISNLMPMPKGEHISLHNKHRNQKRGQNGQFIKNDTQRIST